MPFIFIFTLSEWEIQYQLIFCLLAVLIVFGLKYYFEVIAVKIENISGKTCYKIYRRIISGIIIIVIAIIYSSKIYNVAFGDYAKSWNNSYNVLGIGLQQML